MFVFLTENTSDNVLHLDKFFPPETLFQLLNTAVIIVILAYVLYKPVLNFLNNRAERIRKQIDDAEINFKNANELKTQYEAKLSEIEAERSNLLEQAHKRALERETQIISEAKREAELLLARAKDDIKHEQAKARDDIKTQMIEISSLMATRFVVANMDEKAHNKLLDEVIEDLGDAQWLN